MIVPFCDLSEEHTRLRRQLHAALDATLDASSFIQGNAVTLFENEFASFVGAAHCVGVSNGTDALELILRALQVQPQDEVIVPASTFAGTAAAVCLAGATPVFCDVDAYGLMSADSVAPKINERTRAVIPVHLYGRCVDMAGLRSLTAPHRIALVEDACQAHGATYGPRMAGTLGDAAAFSFYPSKNLGALGDAGAVTTGDKHLAARIRMLGNYGAAEKYVVTQLGRNARLDELQAAFLRVKLPQLSTALARRRQHASAYCTDLAALPLQLPRLATSDAYHLFAVQTVTAEERTHLANSLSEQGIITLSHYPIPLHQQTAFARFARGPLPGAEQHARTTLSLPMYPALRDVQRDHVIDAVHAFYKKPRSRS